MTKPVWLITNMDHEPALFDIKDQPREFKSEKAALKATGDALDAYSDHSEVWVWKLTHVASRPKTEPEIDAVE